MAPCRFLVVLLLALTAAAPATQAAPLTVLTGRADGLVPAVQGTVSGRPLWLALDTGAHESFVDTSMVRDLALPTLGDTAITGSGKGQVSATKLKPVTFHLNDVTFTAQAPLATDLSNTGSAFTLGGILGFDFFSRYVVAIDFTSYRVSLYEPQSYRYDGSGVAIPLILRPPRAFVSVVVSAAGVKAERHELRLDLGSNDAVDDDIVLRSSAPKHPTTSGVGIGKSFSAYLGTVTTLQIGPFTLHDLPSATGGVQLIGDEVWHRFDVVFDFSRSVMYLTPKSP